MTNELRILTVRQPWAWAIIHGGKGVENRVRNIAGGYRGPVAIHVAKQEDVNAFSISAVRDVLNASADVWYDEQLAGHRHPDAPWPPVPWGLDNGRIIGVVDLRATHHAEFCADEPEPCSQWAEPGEMWHLELANPRPLTTPIPYRGALGMRRLDEETAAAVWSQIGEQR